MLQNTQIAYTFSASLVRLVGAGWHKSGMNLKTTLNSEVFVPLAPQQKNCQLFDHHCKGKVFTNILMWKVCFQRVWFRLCSRGDRSHFFSLLLLFLRK